MIPWENVQGAHFIDKLQKEIDTLESGSETLQGEIGTLTNLTTSAKTNVVSAVNEVDSHADTNSANIGTLSDLTTSVKTDIVSAINSLNQVLGRDYLKVVYLGSILKDESMTFDVEGDSKFILAMFGTAQTRTGCYMVNISPNGSATVVNVVAGTDIAITSSTGTITVANNTSTADRAVNMYALVFSGSIEEHTT